MIRRSLIKMARRILLISSSKVHGYEYLECASNDIKSLLNKADVKRILFIPYALNDHEKYLKTVSGPLSKLGYDVDGIHNSNDPIEEIKRAEAIFIGGGNTFLLLKTLYDKKLIEPIRKRVLVDGVPYIGSSAGTNVATRSIHTTNDMPIVYPPSFEALKLVPFNVNPHYQDPDKVTKHKGETREERITQFLQQSTAAPVLGLREGSSLLIEGDKATLKGLHNARLFIPNEEPKEVTVESDLSYLLQPNQYKYQN